MACVSHYFLHIWMEFNYRRQWFALLQMFQTLQQRPIRSDRSSNAKFNITIQWFVVQTYEDTETPMHNSINAVLFRSTATPHCFCFFFLLHLASHCVYGIPVFPCFILNHDLHSPLRHRWICCAQVSVCVGMMEVALSIYVDITIGCALDNSRRTEWTEPLIMKRKW